MPARSHQTSLRPGKRPKSKNQIGNQVGKIAQNLKSFQNKVEKEFTKIGKKFERIDREFKAVRKEIGEKTAFLFKKIDAVDQKVEGIEQRIAEFRNEMLTIMDFVRKDYDNFRHEKFALAAGQDRLQVEVDQNGNAIHELEVRVTRLESV